MPRGQPVYASDMLPRSLPTYPKEHRHRVTHSMIVIH